MSTDLGTFRVQSQSLLQKYKKPWRIQRPPGVGMDQFDGYNEPPPPSATLHSSQENLTAPVWPVFQSNLVSFKCLF